jgi:hypothetical protein
MRALIENTRAFVRVDANLADAKDAMDKMKGSQDVFVTQSGGEREPVLGWLTNVDILKYAAKV